MNNISVTIGNDLVLYQIRQTKAPCQYDGFGTFEVANYAGDRVVLIRDEHYQWQMGRYASGLFACDEPALTDIADVKAILWRRILGLT